MIRRLPRVLPLLRSPVRTRRPVRRAGASRQVVLRRWQRHVRHATRLLALGACGFVVLAAMALVAPTLRDGLDQPIRQVRILNDLYYQDPEAIRLAIAAQPLGRFSQVPLDAIRQGIESLEWIQQAHVRRVWPDGLQVRVREQIPTARWGEGMLLNEHGETFRVDSTAAFAQLPALHGPDSATRTVLAMHQRIAPLLGSVGLRLQELRVSPRGAWDLTLDNGVLVRLGRGEAVARTARFVAFYQRQLVGRIHTVAVVDTRYSNGIAVTWAPGQVIGDSEGNKAG